MNELNLIPYSMKKIYVDKNKRWNLMCISIIIFAGLFFTVYFPVLYLQQLQGNKNLLKAQVDAQYNVIEERKQMEEQMNTTNELITLVDNFDKGRKLSYQYITEIQNLLPADVSCISWNYTEGTITMTGKSQVYQSPAIFVANLQETETYKNSNLMSIVEGDTGYTFSITIGLTE